MDISSRSLPNHFLIWRDQLMISNPVLTSIISKQLQLIMSNKFN